MDPYKEGGCHGPKGTKPPNEYKGLQDEQALQAGLDDRYEVDAVKNYLVANGRFMLKTVRTLYEPTLPYV